MEIKVGDKITIAGLYLSVPNPARKWWQFWKPQMVITDGLQNLTVTRALVAKPQAGLEG